MCSIFTLCRAVKAVSELEKKADSKRQTIKSTRYSVCVLSIYHHPTLKYRFKNLLANLFSKFIIALASRGVKIVWLGECLAIYPPEPSLY